jgi:hypothetical protein
MFMAQEIRNYANLLQQIRNDLRIQHPEWIQQDGESPMCDSYEARLLELLDASRPIEANENAAVLD